MEDKERFTEDLFDAALKQHHREPPRAGLEGRILAGVAARQRAGRRRWLWAFAAATVAAAIVVIVLHATRPRTAPVPAPSRAAVTTPRPPVTFTFSKPKPAAPHPKREPLRRVAAAPGRPAQFPTPRPLTESERLLLRYTQVVPKQVLATPPAPPLSQDLDIPSLNIADLEIKPLPDSDSQAAK